MNLKEILEYKLLEFDKYSISVYDLFAVLILFLIIQALVWGVSALINRTAIKKKLDKGQRFTLKKLIQYGLYTIGTVIAFETIGIDVKILLAGSAALLVGIGLGIQHIFNDIVSGFIILFEGSIQVGDIIEVDKLVAKVEKIDIRTSKVLTLDGNSIIVPNSLLTSNNVLNWSHQVEETRFHIPVGVAYGSDTEKVKRVLENVANAHPNVITDRTTVFFIGFGNSSLDFDLIFWSQEKWLIERVKSELRFNIDKAFREHNITIPFPQRDVYVKRFPQQDANPSGETVG